MKEKELQEHYNKLCTDKDYGRKIMELPIEGDLAEQDERYYELELPLIKKEVLEEIKKYQQWTSKKESGVPLRYRECDFDNFEIKTDEERKRKNQQDIFID